jgi:diguanylate cyclase (GGDEF)-like protein
VKETRFFFYEERYNLAVILILYVLSVLTLFFINTRVERRHFKELAAKDPMTGLLNRRGLEEYISSATRSEYVALAVLDIDNFKLINDNYGHDMGDNVICYVADQIANSTRDSDAVARFGGEEFVIYLRGRDQDQLIATLERVRTIIGQESKRILDSGFTVSGGVVVTSYEESRDFDKLFKAADEKLYIAKTTGKDKLEC